MSRRLYSESLPITSGRSSERITYIFALRLSNYGTHWHVTLLLALYAFGKGLWEILQRSYRRRRRWIIRLEVWVEAVADARSVISQRAGKGLAQACGVAATCTAKVAACSSAMASSRGSATSCGGLTIQVGSRIELSVSDCEQPRLTIR